MRLFLVRHAVVEARSRTVLYGTMDVELCRDTLAASGAVLREVAEALPRPARWVITPLRRTRDTAAALFAAGYPAVADLLVEPDLQEQHLGEWQGLTHDALRPLLRQPADHPFWPLRAEEEPPGGESMVAVVDRVGAVMERLAETHADRDVVAVSHGGAIRAAVAHAMRAPAEATLHVQVQNLSVTALSRHPEGWRVGAVNWMPGLRQNPFEPVPA